MSLKWQLKAETKQRSNHTPGERKKGWVLNLLNSIFNSRGLEDKLLFSELFGQISVSRRLKIEWEWNAELK